MKNCRVLFDATVQMPLVRLPFGSEWSDADRDMPGLSTTACDEQKQIHWSRGADGSGRTLSSVVFPRAVASVAPHVAGFKTPSRGTDARAG